LPVAVKSKRCFDHALLRERLLLSTFMTELLNEHSRAGNKTGNSSFTSVTSKENQPEMRSFVMTGKISTFAIMACVASSLAFAADKAKSISSADDAKANTTQTAITDNTRQDSTSSSNCKKKDKKDNHRAKPAPSNQEREFDRVLMGIYG
jgi:hypothetical protein